MHRVLVTGITGRVGSNVALQLLAAGYDVRGMVHPADPAVHKLEGLGEVDVALAALDDADGIARAMSGVDLVVHLAAQIIRGATPVDRFFDTNALGTLRLLEAAARSGRVQRFVLASTDGTYAPTRPVYLPLDEQHPQEPGDYYGTSKLLAEQLVRNYGAQYGLPFTIVRFGSVVAPDEVLDLFRLSWATRLLRAAELGRDSPLWRLYVDTHEPWQALTRVAGGHAVNPAVALAGPDGTPWALHLTDVRDTARGTVIALEHRDALGEAFNIVGPRTVTFAEGSTLIAEALSLPRHDVVVPATFRFAVDGSKASRILGFEPAWDFPAMVRSAIAFRRGDRGGVVGAAPPLAAGGLR